MSNAYLGTTSAISEHDVTLTIMGDVESVRARLTSAIERVGYTVIGEQPLYGKRNAKGGARWDCSFEVLDYPTRLTISLKQLNNIAVVATFNYEVKSYKHMTKGDRQTLVREAEAIGALASERLSISACPACATPVTDDSHFCRRCGAPLVVEVAELEVLRLTRKSRTAHHNLIIGVVTLCLAAVLLAPVFWVDPKAAKVLLLMGAAFGTFGLFALLQGIWQLHFTLNPSVASAAASRPAAVLAAANTQALPPAAVRGSVTEGTTELLVSNDEAATRRDIEPVLRRSLDTGEVDDERLM